MSARTLRPAGPPTCSRLLARPRRCRLLAPTRTLRPASALCARFRVVPQIQLIAFIALRLVCVGREEIMSTVLDAAPVVPGRSFAPAEMSDAFTDTVRAQAAGAWAPGPGAGERVLCTTEVGLVCATRVEERGEVQRVVLLKPKVVLESVTRVLEER
jgi:hypothetical protein